MTAPVLVETTGDGTAVVTLNRPDVRNAIDSVLLRELRAALADLDGTEDVAAIVLTGADPVFCAGLDLRELSGGGPLEEAVDRTQSRPPWGEPLRTPLIGAINGAAVTGGLEIALNCDILIASEKARFADTHARVGVLPGWRLSVLLPLAVGPGLARRMSLTGDFLSADQALRAGLVTDVVPHDELLPAALRVAATIAGNDQAAVRTLLGSYRRLESELVGDGDRVEAATAREWLAAAPGSADVERRREDIIERGRAQNRG
ncbi:enoyl-CoA hydratase [Amycolatopsis acidicola]|uniref:Enoyl-CoA hydratase n=1 Tax=Amycolatopsis acidicola TaxID=2596893 RepID=A0A5N0UVY9_9PSEU|nr:enoyl-CoA hydratase [Amycolatopsis acidicola]KAA9156745.1 enoyl-CoA hydratase [Amycolatopsis acidicola]